MKTFSPLFFFVFMVLPFQAATAKGTAKGKGKGHPPAVTASADSPAEALAPYITKLDALLALERSGPPKQQAFLNEAHGHLTVLRAEFAAKQSTVPETERAKFAAAVATCDALTAALNERQQTLSNIHASSHVGSSGKLEQGPRKDNLTQGIHGGDLAKAVGSEVELARERRGQRQAAHRNAQTNDAMTAMAVNRWNQRAIELRQKITASYAATK